MNRVNTSPDDPRLVRRWLAAAARDEIRAALGGVYEEIERAVARSKPVCAQSGRCCRFEEYGHRLYVTGLEAAATLLGAGLVEPACADSARVESAHLIAPNVNEGSRRLPILHDHDGRDARPTGLRSDGRDARPTGQRPSCPLLIRRACGVHAHRPCGCRVFFCDESWTPRMGAVAERAVARVRAIHDRFDVPYRYTEWRALLDWFAAEIGPIELAGGAHADEIVGVTIGGRRPGRGRRAVPTS